jgi:hypothetical protein
MSADPQQMAQMLASQLGNGQQPGAAPQGGNPLAGGAAQLAQKIMLMRALQQGQPPPQPGQPPNPTAMGAPGLPGQALPQGLNQAPLPGAVNG